MLAVSFEPPPRPEPEKMIRVSLAAALILATTRMAVSAWEIEVVDSGAVSSYSSLKVERRSEIHISYYTGGAIRYASWVGAAWTFSDFESDSDMETDISLAVDRSDLPHVSYYGGYFYGEVHDLKSAHFDGSFWATSVVDSPGQIGRGSSIALDSFDMPHISYYDETNVTLKYARFDGTRWSVTTLDDVEFIAFNFRTAIVVGSQDHVHIVYSAYHYESPDWIGRLKYAFFDGTDWTISVIEEGLPTRDFRIPAIALDATGRPYVSYLFYYDTEPITPDLKYARFDGGG